MKYFKYLLGGCLIILLLIIPEECKSQRVNEKDKTVNKYHKIRPYINLGYISNLPGPEDDIRSGGSIRIGILTKGRFGFQLGYTRYNVKLYDLPPDYEDKGSALLFGVDFRLMNKAFFQWYLHAGLANDTYESVYAFRTEKEHTTIPQLGFIFHIRKFNTFLGMGGDNFNIGVGITI